MECQSITGGIIHGGGRSNYVTFTVFVSNVQFRDGPLPCALYNAQRMRVGNAQTCNMSPDKFKFYPNMSFLPNKPSCIKNNMYSRKNQFSYCSGVLQTNEIKKELIFFSLI